MFGPRICCGDVNGRRVDLVPVQHKFLANYVRWFSDPDVTRFMSAEPVTIEQEEEWFGKTETSAGDVTWAIVVDDQHVGGTNLHCIDRRTMTAASGLVIGEKRWWRKGIAALVAHARTQYAFEDLSLRAIFTEVCVENGAMLHIAQEKIGYVQYGIKPFGLAVDGECFSTWLGVITPESWHKP